MTANLLNEPLIPAKEACKIVPGGPIELQMLLRWARQGIRGVKLEVYRRGGRVFTSAAAVQRFLAQLNGDAARMEAATDMATF